MRPRLFTLSTGYPPRLWMACITLLLVGFGASSATAQTSDTSAPAGSEWLQQIQSRYNAMDGIRARFVRTVESEFASTQSVEGTLLLSGSRYRVETASQTFVTDGTTTWIYSPGQQQVVVNDAVTDSRSLTPDSFFTDYADRYEIQTQRDSVSGDQRYEILSLVPSSDEAAFDGVVLWVNPETMLIERLQVTDANDNRITIRLRDITLNPGLDASVFQFNPPTDVEVVDLRAS